MGFLALFVGLVTFIGALDEGAGAEIVTGPMLLAGFGIGSLASQLGSVSSSADGFPPSNQVRPDTEPSGSLPEPASAAPA